MLNYFHSCTSHQIFFFWKHHTSTNQKTKLSFWLFTCLWWHPTIWCRFMNLFHFQCTSTFLAMSLSLLRSATTTWSWSTTQNPINWSRHLTFRLATRWGRPIFAKGGMSSSQTWPRHASAPCTLQTDAKNIQTRCKFSISRAQEKIFRLDSNTYVVYSLGKINTNYVWPKGKSFLAVQISSGQTIRINPSSYIRTMDHIIKADSSKEIKIHSKRLNWTWTLGQLFQQSENKMVTSAIEKLRSKISG